MVIPSETAIQDFHTLSVKEPAMDTRRSQQYSLLSKQETSSQDDDSISDEGDSLTLGIEYKQPSRLRKLARVCVLQIIILAIYTILLVPLLAIVLPKVTPPTWKQQNFCKQKRSTRLEFTEHL